MYMQGVDYRVANAQPLRVIPLSTTENMVGLGFLPAGGLAVVGASTGPPGWIVTGIATAASLIVGLLRKGHDDDKVGEAEGQLYNQTFPRVLSEVLGRQVGNNWQNVQPAENEVQAMLNRGEWRLSAEYTAQLLAYVDDVKNQWCGQMSSTKWPCRDYIPGKTGAGTLIYGDWGRIHNLLSAGLQLATAREAAAAAAAPDGLVDALVDGDVAGAAAQASSWLGGKTTIGGQAIPNIGLALAGGAVLYMAMRKAA